MLVASGGTPRSGQTGVTVVMMVVRTPWRPERSRIRSGSGAVVDATAVRVHHTPRVVDVLELNLSVPAFDPMESDEEDEFDAGVPLFQ